MRNLAECQAEVFRRSEKRINARKQRRKHILLACAPLALCLGIFGWFFSPEDAAQDPLVIKPAMGTSTNASTACTVAKVTVLGSGVSVIHTDTTTLIQISDFLDRCTGLPAATGSAAEETLKDSLDVPNKEYSYSANSAYTVALVTHWGETTQYRLSGSILTNMTDGQAYTLTREQETQLRKLLGIL